MQIMGGKVTYARTVQPAQYESKKAEVEISFTLSDGEEMGDSLDRAGNWAMQKCHEMVGITKPAPMAATAEKIAEKVEAIAEGVKAAAEAPKDTKGKGKTQAEKDAAKAEAAAKMNGKKATAPLPDPDALPDEPTQAISSGEERVSPDDNDTSFLDEPSTPAREIKDTELYEAAGKKNKELMPKHAGASPAMIKALVQKFVPLPKQLKDIPQEQRTKFLEQLAALT